MKPLKLKYEDFKSKDHITQLLMGHTAEQGEDINNPDLIDVIENTANEVWEAMTVDMVEGIMGQRMAELAAKKSRVNDDGLRKSLTNLLNQHSVETKSDTSDKVLANFMLRCLDAWETGVREREFQR